MFLSYFAFLEFSVYLMLTVPLPSNFLCELLIESFFYSKLNDRAGTILLFDLGIALSVER